MVRYNVGTTSNLPPDHPSVPAGSGSEACPVNPSSRATWLAAASSSSSSSSSTPSIQTASSSGSGSGSSSSKRHSSLLSSDREISSIPRGPLGTTPVHVGSSEGSGEDGDKNWVYPSELQFFQAMARKNHKPKANDMKNVVGIHNAVNEKAWEEVLRWERGLGGEKCGGPRLISFAGIPTKRTPKAWMNIALGYSPPFDRHDWIIDRCGTNVRYVIDFYTGRSDPQNPQKMSFFLDCRPALDNRVGIETRIRGLWKEWVG